MRQVILGMVWRVVVLGNPPRREDFRDVKLFVNWSPLKIIFGRNITDGDRR